MMILSERNKRWLTMAKYTTELRHICEHLAGLDESEGYNSIATIIEQARPKVFKFNYPIFDEEYRSVLETKILKHYYTREISGESFGIWQLWLDTRLNEIMPYYNKLYLSELIEFNPMYDVDLTTTRDIAKDSDKSGNTSSNVDEESQYTTADKNDHWDMYQDTPSGGLNGVRQENYLTNARHVTDDTTGSTGGTTGSTDSTGTYSETINDTEDYLEKIVGKTGGKSYSQMLNEFRDTFLNIDTMIINDLSDLFFNLW